jgi:hypothetical protein
MARGRSPKCSLTLQVQGRERFWRPRTEFAGDLGKHQALPSFTSATTHKPSESLITGIYQCHHTPWRRNNTPIEPSMMREDDVTNATMTRPVPKAQRRQVMIARRPNTGILGVVRPNEAGQSPAQQLCELCGPFKLKGYGQQVNPEAGLSGPGQYDLIRVLSNTTNFWVNTY